MKSISTPVRGGKPSQAPLETSLKTLELTFLGRCQVVCHGKVLPFRSSQHLALLASLALEGRVSRKVLAERIWGHTGSPLGNLHAARTHVVARIGEAHWQTQDEDYALRDFHCDLTEFLERAERFEPDAWAYWRGPFVGTRWLGDPHTGGEPGGGGDGSLTAWVEEVQRRLYRALSALATRAIPQHLERGEHREALHKLEALREQAQRAGLLEEVEDLTRAAILMCGALGETAQAQRWQRGLVAFLTRYDRGATPLRSTVRALEQALGGQREACRQSFEAEARWQRVPLESAPGELLVGRGREFEQVRQLLRGSAGRPAGEVAGARVQVAWLQGEPGMGKTRLAAQITAHFGPVQDWLCFTASSVHVPLHLLEELGREVQQRRPQALQALLETMPAPWRAALGRLLPSLGSAESAPLSAELERKHLFLGTRALLETLPGPLRLWVDDLHWLDAASLAFLEFLLVHPPAGGLQVLLGERHTEESLSNLHRLRGLMLRLGGGGPLRLAPLTLQATEELLQRLHAPPTLAPELLAISGGNPFYLLELIRSGEQRPTNRLQELIEHRLEGLPEGGRALLEALAVLDGPAPLGLLSRVSAQPLEAVDALLAHLERLGLLQGNALEQTEFQHDLIRGVVAGTTRPARRSLLHLRAARGRHAQPLSAAQHYWQAREVWEESDAENIRATFLEAAEQLALRSELESGLLWLERLLGFERRPRPRLEIFLHQAHLLERHARYREAEETLRWAQSLLGEVNDALLEARFKVARAWGMQSSLRSSEHIGSWAREALESVSGWSGEAARQVQADAHTVLGWEAFQKEALPVARGHYETARELRLHLSDRSKLAGILSALGLILAQQGEPGARECLEEGVKLRRELGDLPGLARGLTNLGGYHHQRGEWIEATAAYGEAIGVQESLENPTEVAFVQNNLALALMAQGHGEQAVLLYRQALRALRLEESLTLHDNLVEALVLLARLDEARLELEVLERRRSELRDASDPFAQDLTQLCLDLERRIEDAQRPLLP